MFLLYFFEKIDIKFSEYFSIIKTVLSKKKEAEVVDIEITKEGLDSLLNAILEGYDLGDRKTRSLNDIVLDNTMGVGTCPLAAKELNRRFIGIEKEVKYYDLAVGRVFGQHCH